MRKRKSGSSAILAHRRDISIPVLSFDKGVCTVSNLKDEMPQNPIINESMAILMKPRFWHGSRRMKNQRLKQSSINDPSLKEYRLKELETLSRKQTAVSYKFVKGSIADRELVGRVFREYQPDIVVNLAAQAGVRYSIDNPDVYIESNIVGFYNILEACRHHPVEHLVYASNSVYGGNKKVPFSTDDRVDNPVSLYAATKKSNELMAHCYSKLYNIPSTGLRFFTVYGPAGRPDMAYFGFTNKLLRGQTIQIYNYGNCRRDFTYVDDIVEGIVRVMKKAPQKRTGPTACPFRPMPCIT